MSQLECQELYRSLLRVLDEESSGGGTIHYIRALQETTKCDHVVNHRPLRSHLDSKLSQHEPGTLDRIVTGDYELEDRSYAIAVLDRDRSFHQRQLVQGLPLRERLWYWTGHQLQRFLQQRSQNSHRHYPGQ
jgi:hypothetical protein